MPPETAWPVAAARHHSIPPTHSSHSRTTLHLCNREIEKRQKDRGGRKRGRDRWREEGRRAANRRVSMFSTLQLLINHIFLSLSSSSNPNQKRFLLLMLQSTTAITVVPTFILMLTTKTVLLRHACSVST